MFTEVYRTKLISDKQARVSVSSDTGDYRIVLHLDRNTICRKSICRTPDKEEAIALANALLKEALT